MSKRFEIKPLIEKGHPGALATLLIVTGLLAIPATMVTIPIGALVGASVGGAGGLFTGAAIAGGLTVASPFLFYGAGMVFTALRNIFAFGANLALDLRDKLRGQSKPAGSSPSSPAQSSSFRGVNKKIKSIFGAKSGKNSSRKSLPPKPPRGPGHGR